MSIQVLYYSITFIIALFMIGRITGNGFEDLPDGKADVRRSIIICRIGLIAWSICIFLIGVSQNDVIDRVFLLLSEFIRMIGLVAGVELFSAITDNFNGRQKTLYTISSLLLYFGVATLAIRLFFDKATIAEGPFGTYFVMGKNLGLVLYIFFHIIVLFFYATYAYMYMYTCTKKREYYISRQCIIIVAILVVCLVIESVCYTEFSIYVPSMYVGALICRLYFEKLIRYMRSIEYDERDYQNILAPSHNKPAFVCNDEGRVIFENTRAYVMKQTYKDTYSERLITDIFDITDYDKERLADPRMAQTFSIYCKYPRQDLEMVLSVKHRLDKFGSIFATEIEVETEENVNVNSALYAKNAGKSDEKTDKLAEVSFDALSNMRTEQLIKQIEFQKALYERANRHLFMLNLKGISKSASVLGLSALEELCDRIQEEMVYGEWECLNSMLIELDRQYETLKIIHS